MRSAAVAGMILALATPGVARAEQAACLTRTEFVAVSTYTLPSAIRGAVQRCSAVLPANAFLRTDGEKLAQRHAAGRDKAWPAARAGLIKAGAALDPGAPEWLRALPDETARPIVDELVISIVDQQMPIDRCKALDRSVMLLSPLPAAGVAGIIALSTGLAALSGQTRIGRLQLCRA